MTLTTSDAQAAQAHPFLRQKLGHFINGRVVESASGKTFETLNPATGKVLASASVVRGAARIAVEFFDGSRVAARVLTASAPSDMVLLQLDKVPEKAVVAQLGDSSSTAVGDEVFLIGSPRNRGLSVSGVSARLVTEPSSATAVSLDLLQLELAPLPESSGCPVFNAKGEVIGMVSQALAKASTHAQVTVAVTSNLARALLLEDKNGRAAAVAR